MTRHLFRSIGVLLSFLLAASLVLTQQLPAQQTDENHNSDQETIASGWDHAVNTQQDVVEKWDGMLRAVRLPYEERNDEVKQLEDDVQDWKDRLRDEFDSDKKPALRQGRDSAEKQLQDAKRERSDAYEKVIPFEQEYNIQREKLDMIKRMREEAEEVDADLVATVDCPDPLGEEPVCMPAGSLDLPEPHDILAPLQQVLDNTIKVGGKVLQTDGRLNSGFSIKIIESDWDSVRKARTALWRPVHQYTQPWSGDKKCPWCGQLLALPNPKCPGPRR